MHEHPSALKTRDINADSHVENAWDQIPFNFHTEQPFQGPFFISGDSTSFRLMLIAEELL